MVATSLIREASYKKFFRGKYLSPRQVLAVCEDEFGFEIICDIIRLRKLQGSFDLLLERELKSRLNDVRFSDYFNEVRFFTRNIRDPRKLSNIIALFELIWLRNRLFSNYRAIIFCVYRSPVTSVLLKGIKGAKLIAFKQGDDSVNLPNFKMNSYVSPNFLTFYSKIYYALFGAAELINISGYLEPELLQDPQIRSLSYWRCDPFRNGRIVVIGRRSPPRQEVAERGNLKFLFPISPLGKRKYSQSVLVIGERTPPFNMWDKELQQALDLLFREIKAVFHGLRFYLRPRIGLTKDLEMYKGLDPLVLDPCIPFVKQLLDVNPSLVISIKSTACAVAARYSYNAICLYRALPIRRSYIDDLDSLFAMDELVQFPVSPDEISKLCPNISRGFIPSHVYEESSADLDEFVNFLGS